LLGLWGKKAKELVGVGILDHRFPEGMEGKRKTSKYSGGGRYYELVEETLKRYVTPAEGLVRRGKETQKLSFSR